jgi:hypothetical protein
VLETVIAKSSIPTYSSGNVAFTATGVTGTFTTLNFTGYYSKVGTMLVLMVPGTTVTLISSDTTP